MKSILLPLLFCAFAANGSDAFAPEKPDPAAAGMDAARLARISARMKEFVDQGTAAGFVTLVARHGRLAILEAVGYQDREAKIPMRTDTLFRIASMTKPMTVAGLMILVDEARIGLLDPVEKYLPEFKGIKLNPCGAGRSGAGCELVDPPRPFTVRDLMTHTSGLPGQGASAGAGTAGSEPVRSLADRVRTGARVTLLAEPGTVWNYSNIGFATLGRLVEVVSGQPYGQFMEERVFQPLGMTDTAFFPAQEKAGRQAAMYTLDAEGKLARAASPAPAAVRIPAPEGGLWSTAADQSRFYQMLLNRGTLNGKRILSAAAVEAMTTNQTGDLKGAEFAPGLGMGFGFGVVREAVGTFRYQSVGTFAKGGAYRTYGWGDPAKAMLGIIMFQRTNGAGDMAPEITAFATLANAAVER
jgi:CubicO group peptidase (beta-lactamase class C family)